MIRGASRRLFRSWHRWLAISLGVWFSLVGITGSLLCFDYEIDLALNQALRGNCPRSANLAELPLDRLLNQAREVLPLRRPVRMSIPYGGDVVRVYFDGPGTFEVALSRCSGEILGVRDFDISFVGVVYQLHAQLLAGEAGRVLVGLLGFGFLASLISGFLLWWPGKHRWTSGWAVDRTSSNLRLVFDLHRVAGATVGLVLTLTVTTGVAVSFPKETRWLVGSLLCIEKAPSELGHSAPVVNLDADAQAGQMTFPDATLTGIRLPSSKRSIAQFVFRQPFEPMKYTGQTVVRVLTGGRVEILSDARHLPPGELILKWLFPLHTGEALSLPGRLINSAAGLMTVAFLATGVWLWLRRRATQRAAKCQAPTKPIASGP